MLRGSFGLIRPAELLPHARADLLVQRRAFLASYFGPGWLAGINQLPARPFIAGSALSGLMWTLTIGLGAFFVGPSLVSAYDDVGKWVTIAALGVAASVALFIVMRRGRSARRSPAS